MSSRTAYKQLKRHGQAHDKFSTQTTNIGPKQQAELTWAAELRLNFISTQVPRHSRLKEGELKLTGSDPAGYDSGDVSQYFGDLD